MVQQHQHILYFSHSTVTQPVFHRFCSGFWIQNLKTERPIGSSKDPFYKKMTVVEDHRMDDPRDQFPVGMRVLAVDDDPACLKILETLLRRCQYHVTSTKNAITALKLLRENKNKFDLVISDVHMPDMDGFKLLELVGLEMDLPVIMLSANDDPKMVMKGITHGACDYLLKPVRIEELQIIWQHVIRRRKISKTSNEDSPNSDSCNKQGSAATANSDQDVKPSRKRKDQNEDDDEEHENDHDNEDPTTQKKPRVVWSVELHRKFVAAVNQLGVDKAVPKKILDMMNVEKLTRENVASHLQKYRLYLKRISCVANQQANMVAALSSADSSYLQTLNGVGHLQTMSGSRQFHNNALRSFPPGGMISRLNTPTSLNVHGLPSSGTLKLGQAQNLNNSINDQLKFQPAIVRSNQNGIQGMPMFIELDQLQPNKGVCPIQNAKTTFPITNKFPGYKPKVTIGCSPSPVLDVSNNALMLEANPQDKQVGGAYKNSTSVASQHSQFSPSLLDNGRCNGIWSSSMQSPGTNSYLSRERFGQAVMPPTDNITSAPLQGGNLNGASSITSLSNQPHDSLTDMHSQGVIFTDTPGQISTNVPFQGWDNHNEDGSYHSHVIGSSIGSLIPMNGGALDAEGHNSTFNRNLDFSFCDPLQMKPDGIMELRNVMNQQKSQNSGISNNLGSLDDLVSAMMKQKQDKMKSLDGYTLYDNNYSGGTPL